jgi:hypothetical protein
MGSPILAGEDYFKKGMSLLPLKLLTHTPYVLHFKKD